MPTNEYNRKRYAERKSKGLCSRCPNLVLDGRSFCQTCRQKHSQRSARRQDKLAAANCCVSCTNPREQIDRVHCDSCLEKIRVRRAIVREERAESGLCFDCGVAAKYRRCQTCYLKMLSVNYFGTTEKHIDLQTQFALQGGLCPYTGRRMTIGSGDCELDHKHPRSKGGGNELSNLEWVYAPINQMKHSLTKEDFMLLVYEIKRHC